MSRFDNSGLSFVEIEFCEGYLDGRDMESPRPGRNRSPAYKHSWLVGRYERRGKAAFGSASRAWAKAAIAEEKMREGVGG